MNLKTVTILIVILLSHYIASSQTWNANFNGIDSIWQDLGGDPNIHVLKNINSELYLGGPFDNVGTQTVNGIAKYDSISWSGFNNGVDWGNVECIIEYKGEIVIGGNFTNADGQANTEAFAIWDGSNWYGLTGLQTTWVWDLEVYNDTLFIAYQLGDFKGIIAYDGISLLDVGNLNTNWVKTLIVYNDTLYAGGYSGFHKYMGGTLWEEAHGGTNERVNDMVVDTFNNFLYVGSGGFTVVGGYLPAYPVAIWDCFSWTSIGTIPNWAIYPKGMAIYRGDLYIGGYLDPYSGKTFNNIARWNGSVWDTLNGGCSAEVGALEVFKDELYVGGYFDYVDDTMRAYGLASWFVPDTGCGYLKPRVQTYIDTFYMSNGQAEVQFYNNNVYADSWSWDFGDTVTDTIKDPAHIYTEKGDYTVQVTVTHGACTKTATKDITIAWVVGKEEIEMKETGFRLYPNPTTNTMFVEIISDELGVISEKLQIIDINGALVYQTAIDNNQLTIQIEDLAKGVYFVKIGEQTERFVKE